MMFYNPAPAITPFQRQAYEIQDSRLTPMFQPVNRNAMPLESESLLKGHKIVEIVHNGNLYKLQATKLGKLILTK